ncbi:hypothetical protein [Streptomyces sp. NPDC001275]
MSSQSQGWLTSLKTHCPPFENAGLKANVWPLGVDAERRLHLEGATSAWRPTARLMAKDIASWANEHVGEDGTGPASWLRPVGVQRGTRAPDQSACPPSWLTFVGWGTDDLRGEVPPALVGATHDLDSVIETPGQSRYADRSVESWQGVQ